MKTPVEFESDGQIVRGMFKLADGDQQLPTVLMLGGFPPGEGAAIVGQVLMEHGINALTFNYRGTGESDGDFSLGNVEGDILAALDYLQREDVVRKFKLDTSRLVLGGMSFGGGFALALAARQPEIKRIFSIAGDDYGQFARQYKGNQEFAGFIDELFIGLEAPSGPIRYDGVGMMKELIRNKDRYDLRLNAPALADRDILLICGWDDVNVTIEDKILPFYRALVDEEAQNVQIAAFQDDHSFGKSREALATLIIRWVKSPGEDQ